MKPKHHTNPMGELLRQIETRKAAEFRDRDWATVRRAGELRILNPRMDYVDAILQAAKELGRNSLTR